MASLEAVEGIGKTYVKKLKAVGINNQSQLLEACCLKKDRNKLIKESGISDKLILKWANRADLIRIKGVGEEYSDLLECSGVDTVPELSKRKPENLHKKMTEVNTKKKLVRQMPSGSQVDGWVQQAKKLPRKICY